MDRSDAKILACRRRGQAVETRDEIAGPIRDEVYVTDLIDAIYAALDDEELFRSLPDRLARAFDARSCALQFWSPETQIEEHLANYFSEEMNATYVANNLDQHDDWAKTLFQYRGLNNGAFRTTDYKPVEQFCESFIYREFFRQFGDDTAMCLGFGDQRADEGIVVVGIHRPLGAEDFSDEEVARLEDLRPHLTRMAFLRKRLATIEERAIGAGMAAHSLGDALIFIDDQSRILFANKSGEELLARGSPLRVLQGVLSAVEPRHQHRLARAASAALGPGSAEPIALRMNDARDRLWRVHVVPRSFEGRRAAMIYVERPVIAQSDAARLRAIYGLSEAEASIAIQVAEGRSAREVADAAALSQATVRTHLQHIFRKTDTHKASQLAMLVASLPSLRTE